MSPIDNPRRRASDVSDDALRDLIHDAVRDAIPPHPCLGDDELQAVRLLIQREAQRARFRTAVIEKSLMGLLAAGLGAFVMIVREYAIAHGMWRP